MPSDRRGPASGVFWLEQPAKAAAAWQEHPIAAAGEEVMFLDVVDFDQDGLMDVIVAIKPNIVAICLQGQSEDKRLFWTEQRLKISQQVTGHAKAVRVGDLDLECNGVAFIRCRVTAEQRLDSY